MDGAGGWMEQILMAIVFAIPLALTTVAVLDAARRPRWAWAMSRHTQVVWMAGLMFSALTVVGGVLAALWYGLVVRPDVAAIENGDIDP